MNWKLSTLKRETLGLLVLEMLLNSAELVLVV